jgi:hypothetical protein
MVALILLARTILWTSKTYSIATTIHNLPIIGIWILLLLGAISLSLFHHWVYLSIGIPFGIFQFILESIDIPGRPSYNLPGKIFSAFSIVFLWPELGSLTLFCLWHADKIVDEEREP